MNLKIIFFFFQNDTKIYSKCLDYLGRPELSNDNEDMTTAIPEETVINVDEFLEKDEFQTEMGRKPRLI